MTREECITKIEELKTIISNHGYVVSEKQEFGNTYGNNYANYNLSIADQRIGCLDYNQYSDEDDWYISLCTETRVIMTDKMSYTKKGVTHKIEIKTNNFKSFIVDDEKNELDKFLVWEDLMVKWLKTAQIKQKRMELDVDFEGV